MPANADSGLCTKRYCGDEREEMRRDLCNASVKADNMCFGIQSHKYTLLSCKR